VNTNAPVAMNASAILASAFIISPFESINEKTVRTIRAERQAELSSRVWLRRSSPNQYLFFITS
jgi:hypothetical protein